MVTPLDTTYTPSFPPLPKHELNWVGRLVHWIRVSKQYSLAYHATIISLTILTSTALILSIVGTPFLLVCFQEYILQREREVYSRHWQHCKNQATENCRHWYLRGLHSALQSSSEIHISAKLRTQLIAELGIRGADSVRKSDVELLQAAAALHPNNWMTQYGLALLDNH